MSHDAKIRPNYVRPLDIKHGRVDMSHGAGGRAMAQLIDELFAPALANSILAQGNDGALLPSLPGLQDGTRRLVMATDAHVVTPLFFPGGDIGGLAIHGTVNDVAMMGAEPLWLSASFIIEEGFPLADLQRIAQSAGAAAREAGVPVVTGDTKVVEAGHGDGVYLTTTGVGLTYPGVEVGGARARPGDVVLVSGPIGDHGLAVLSCRESLGFGSADEPLVSDTAALHGLVAALLAAVPATRVLRDPTRGGVGTTLNEIARQSGAGILLQEAALPVRATVAAACEFLGLDPLYAACEGRLLAICPPEQGAAALAALRAHPLGREAALIGTVVEDPHHFVQMTTVFGGRRIVDWLTGEQLPRIC